ncbi:MAG: MFS transporter [Clostridia bacterium]|nr:MFS transporter [Clostridia bacterium]
MNKTFQRVKYACYATNVSMSVVGNLSPMLFITFRTLYGISYSLLGLLVLINFCTQLIIDLIFSFFSHKFNIPKTVKFTPVLSVLGLVLFALAPILFPKLVYLGLALGTFVFSASSGLSEVLISPTIAAIPAENPEREMSKLHSIYAWGVVFVVVCGTLFLLAFGSDKWQILTLFFALVPLTACLLFAGAKIPEMETPERVSGALAFLKRKDLWLCVFAIFLGGASECTMAQWSSGYLERALGIEKVWGDIFGVALFGLTLGLGRTLFAKYGKDVGKVLFFGAIGASICYLTTALINVPVIGLIACAATGFCVSMLWPGTLIASTDRIPDGGVFIYAMMAAGGDLGASVGPQLIGVITDTVAASTFAANLSTSLALSPEQIGMKAGMLVATLFPLIGIWIYYLLWKGKKRTPKLLKKD